MKQIYALAAELCERAGEEFPETKTQASELIERLRTENGRSPADDKEVAHVSDRGG